VATRGYERDPGRSGSRGPSLFTRRPIGFFPGGGLTEAGGKFTETLRVRVDPELLEAVKKKSKALHTDLSTYVRWCLQTGLFLDDLSAFVRTQKRPE